MSESVDEIKHTVPEFNFGSSVYALTPFILKHLLALPSPFARDFQNMGCDERTHDNPKGGTSCISFI